MAWYRRWVQKWFPAPRGGPEGSTRFRLDYRYAREPWGRKNISLDQGEGNTRG